MWSYLNVPLDGHMRQVLLYICIHPMYAGIIYMIS
jgi:hypothetical protein